MKLLTSIAALLVASSVAAQDNPGAPSSGEATAPPASAPTDAGAPTTPTTPSAAETATAPAPDSSSVLYDGDRWGLQIDAGVPSGATAALVWRPWTFLRLNGGFGYNLAAFGVKGGATLIPFHWGVVPTIGLEGGHFFEGDMSKTAFWEITDASAKQLAKQFSYNYVAADLGVEFGAQNRFVFYVRVGLTQVWSDLNNIQQALDAENPGKFKATQASFTGRTPTARIGFILYLF